MDVWNIQSVVDPTEQLGPLTSVRLVDITTAEFGWLTRLQLSSFEVESKNARSSTWRGLRTSLSSTLLQEAEGLSVLRFDVCFERCFGLFRLNRLANTLRFLTIPPFNCCPSSGETPAEPFATWKSRVYHNKYSTITLIKSSIKSRVIKQITERNIESKRKYQLGNTTFWW